MADHKIFIFNTVLMTGLIGGVLLFQQGGTSVTPIVPISQNSQVSGTASVVANIAPVSAPSSSTLLKGEVVSSSASVPVVQKKVVTTPSIRRHRGYEYNENE